MQQNDTKSESVAYQLGTLEGKMAGMGREIGELKSDQNDMKRVLEDNGKILVQISAKLDNVETEIRQIKETGCNRFEEAHAAQALSNPSIGEFFGLAALTALKYIIVVTILGLLLSAFGLIFFPDQAPKIPGPIPSVSP